MRGDYPKNIAKLKNVLLQPNGDEHALFELYLPDGETKDIELNIGDILPVEGVRWAGWEVKSISVKYVWFVNGEQVGINETIENHKEPRT